MQRNTVVAFIMVLFLGCASVPIVLQEASNKPNQTTFLLNYDLQNTVHPNWDDNCSITLKGLDSNVSYRATTRLKKEMLHLAVPAGNYRIDQMYCESGGKWPIGNFGAREITAFPGKVNYLGYFKFLVTREKLTYELLESHGTPAETSDALRDSLSKLSSDQKSRVVSAYSGKKIDPSIVSNKTKPQRGILSHSAKNQMPTNKLDFSECEKAENKTNPVLLGTLSYHAVYEEDRFLKSELVKNTSTFSDSYIMCVEAEIRNFKPGVSTSVKYDIGL